MCFNTKTVFSFIAVFLIILTLIISPAAAVKVEGARIMPDITPDTNYICPMAVSSTRQIPHPIMRLKSSGSGRDWKGICPSCGFD